MMGSLSINFKQLSHICFRDFGDIVTDGNGLITTLSLSFSIVTR
jgi:hypothetical protein